MRDFTGMKVWKRAHALTVAVYQITANLPPREHFGLAAQLRRSALSVESNIAEGCGRRTEADFARFLDLASGSLSELETQILVVRDTRLAPSEQVDRLLRELRQIRRMLLNLLAAIRKGR